MTSPLPAHRSTPYSDASAAAPEPKPPGDAGWSIRQATADDAEAVVELRMAMSDELADLRSHDYGPDELARRRAQALEGNRTYARDHLGRDMVVWLAEAGGHPVASAGILWFRHPPSAHHPTGLEAYILNVYTRPEWRRRGIARALMETAIAAADAGGANRVWLRASEMGRPLYESMGFGQKNYLELSR